MNTETMNDFKNKTKPPKLKEFAAYCIQEHIVYPKTDSQISYNSSA